MNQRGLHRVHARTGQTVAAALALGLLLAPLTGCAPEPGETGSASPGTTTPGSSKPGATKPGTATPEPTKPGASGPEASQPDGSDLKSKHDPEGGSWPEENPQEVYNKHQDIPADFPGRFVIPQDAVIDDVGSRGPGSWFLVLRASNGSSADVLWAQIVASGPFAVSNEGTNTEAGLVATLTSPELGVTAMTVPQPSGEVLLTYDITAVVQ